MQIIHTAILKLSLRIGVGGGYSLGYESRGSCARSKPVIMSSSLNTNNQVARSQSFAQQRSLAQSGMNPSPSAATDNEEEDSMHEKYFSPNILSMHGKKPAETTPLVSTSNRFESICRKWWKICIFVTGEKKT